MTEDNSAIEDVGLVADERDLVLLQLFAGEDLPSTTSATDAGGSTTIGPTSFTLSSSREDQAIPPRTASL